MRYPDSTFANVNEDEIVIIRLWEIYLLYHPSNLYRILTENSLENGPVQSKDLPGRVIFKFSRKMWQDKVRDLLYEHRIPVSIQSNRLGAVSVKGRHPVLR